MSDPGAFPPAATLELDEQLQADDNGRVQCCIGLVASFYFLDGHTVEVRERIADVFSRYREAVSDALVWGGHPKNGRPTKIKNSEILDLKSWIKRLSRADDFGPAFHGGIHKDDASPYTFTSLSRTWRPGELSSLTFTLPLSWPADKAQGSYLGLILDACKLLEPEHGYAGLGLIPHVTDGGLGEGMPYAVPLAARFRGLEFDFAASHTNDLTKANAIKGVNWLTVLADSWAERVGGERHLAEQLGPEIPIHVYPGGIIILAGAHPRFGDVQRAEPMLEYEAVAKVLKPIRTAMLDSLAPHHGFGKERTAEWLARFDKEPA
jgi:hypothetical protein